MEAIEDVWNVAGREKNLCLLGSLLASLQQQHMYVCIYIHTYILYIYIIVLYIINIICMHTHTYKHI